MVAYIIMTKKECQEFKARLGCTESLYLKRKEKKERRKEEKKTSHVKTEHLKLYEHVRTFEV